MQNKTKNCKLINSKETVELSENIFNVIPLQVLDTFKNRNIDAMVAMRIEL